MSRIIIVTLLIAGWPMMSLAAERNHNGKSKHQESFSSSHKAGNAHRHDRSHGHRDGRSDDRYPRLTVPPAVSVEATGPLTAAALGVAIAVDEDGRSLPVSNDAPAAFPVGSTTVTYKATDEDGHTAVGSQLVTVMDTTPPTITIQQPAITAEATSLSMAVNLGTVTATDLVDGAIVPANNAPSAFGFGVTAVDWTATDAAGNTATVQQLVTVQDTTPPAITAPAAVSADSSTGQPIAVNIGMASAMDIFGPVSVMNNAPANFPIGITTVTWTATDAHGNSATAPQTVMVRDTSILANLPPDPGPAGEATLAGIDSDNDGVRDDVQRWIAINYPSSQKIRAALVQDTKAMQRIVLDAADPIKSYNDALEDNRATQCLSYIRPNDFYRILAEHKAVFLNTHLRSRAWLQADHNLSGKFFGLLPNPRQGCDFNPDAMPN